MAVITCTCFCLPHHCYNPSHFVTISNAFFQRDFETFADITMMDSNQFHATCLDTFPPIFYMNDVSRAVVATVHALNKASGRNLCAYTFDAGPNAVSLPPSPPPPLSSPPLSSPPLPTARFCFVSALIFPPSHASSSPSSPLPVHSRNNPHAAAEMLITCLLLCSITRSHLAFLRWRVF